MTADTRSSILRNTAAGAGSPAAAGGAGGARFAPIDPMKVLRQHATLLVTAFLIAGVVSVGVFFLLKRYMPKYSSQARLEATPPVTDPYEAASGDEKTRMDMLDAYIRNQIIRMQEDQSVLSDVLANPRVKATLWYQSFFTGGQVDLQAAMRGLENDLEPIQEKGSTLITITFSSPNADDPPVILETLLDVFLAKVRGEASRQGFNVGEAFRTKLAEEKVRLDQLQKSMKEFAIANDMPNLESRGHEETIAYQELASQSVKLDLALQQAKEAYEGLLQAQRSGKINPTSEELAAVEISPAVANRLERIRLLREQKEVYLSRFGEAHRATQEIDLQILAVEQEKTREMDRLLRERQAVFLEQAKKSLDALQAQIPSFAEKLKERRDSMREVNLKLEEYRQIEEQANAATRQIENYEASLAKIEMQNARPDAARLYLREPATRPAQLSFPKPLIVIPLLTIFLTGSVTGMVFLKELLDERVKSPSDLKYLAQCPVLGTLPDAAEDPSGPGQIEGVVSAWPKGLMAEQFRQIRAALMGAMDRGGHRTLVLIGAQPHSGASAITQNLAVSIAQNGHKVLVVDANMRRPAQHRLFHAQPTSGLTELLLDRADLDKTLAKTDQPGVWLLGVGDQQRATPELLEGPEFRELLRQLREIFDVVLIDAPPGLLTSEGRVLAKHADAVALIVRAVADKRGMIGRLLAQVDGQNAQVLGVILNAVQSSAGGYFRKNYKAFYDYQGNNGFIHPGASKRKTPAAKPQTVNRMEE